MTVPARPQSTWAGPRSAPGVTRQSGPSVSTVQPSAVRAAAMSSESRERSARATVLGPVADRGEHQRAVGQRLRAGQPDPGPDRSRRGGGGPGVGGVGRVRSEASGGGRVEGHRRTLSSGARARSLVVVIVRRPCRGALPGPRPGPWPGPSPGPLPASLPAPCPCPCPDRRASACSGVGEGFAGLSGLLRASRASASAGLLRLVPAASGFGRAAGLPACPAPRAAARLGGRRVRLVGPGLVGLRGRVGLRGLARAWGRASRGCSAGVRLAASRPVRDPCRGGPARSAAARGGAGSARPRAQPQGVGVVGGHRVAVAGQADGGRDVDLVAGTERHLEEADPGVAVPVAGHHAVGGAGAVALAREVRSTLVGVNAIRRGVPAGALPPGVVTWTLKAPSASETRARDTARSGRRSGRPRSGRRSGRRWWVRRSGRRWWVVGRVAGGGRRWGRRWWVVGGPSVVGPSVGLVGGGPVGRGAVGAVLEADVVVEVVGLAVAEHVDGDVEEVGVQVGGEVERDDGLEGLRGELEGGRPRHRRAGHAHGSGRGGGVDAAGPLTRDERGAAGVGRQVDDDRDGLLGQARRRRRRVRCRRPSPSDADVGLRLDRRVGGPVGRVVGRVAGRSVGAVRRCRRRLPSGRRASRRRPAASVGVGGGVGAGSQQRCGDVGDQGRSDPGHVPGAHDLLGGAGGGDPRGPSGRGRRGSCRRPGPDSSCRCWRSRRRRAGRRR